MNIRIHEPKNATELDEVHVLPCLQRMLDEKWNDALVQIFVPSHPVGHPVAVIGSNHAASEMVFQGVKDLHIAFVLHDGEFRQDLKSGGHFRVAADAHVETAFTVHKTRDPLRVKSHWLLPNIKSLRVPGAIQAFPADCPHVRRIFTAASRGEYRAVFEEFPAYGSVLLRLASTNLRTVIVTAAVYRGFNSKLRLR